MRKFSFIRQLIVLQLLLVFGINSRICFASPETDSIDYLFSLATKYRNEGDYEKTAEIIRLTHRLRQQVFTASSPEITYSYINLARVQILTWEHDSAIESLLKAEEIFHNCSTCDNTILGKIYSQIGHTYQSKGDYLLAETYYKQAEDILSNTEHEDFRRIAILYQRFAAVEFLLKKFDLSIDYFNRSNKFSFQIAENTDLMITSYTGLALNNSELERYKLSIDLQLKAIKLAKKDSVAYSVDLAILYNNIGFDYQNIGDTLAARRNFEHSLNIYKALGVQGTYLAELYESMGSLAMYSHNYSKALSCYQRGLLITSPSATTIDSIENPDFSNIDDKLTATGILKSKIKCLSDLYEETNNINYLNEGINSGLLTIELIEFLQSNSQSYESKIQTSEVEYDIFNTTLALLDKAYKKTGNKKYSELAFEVSEKSKSSILIASLRELDARQFGGIPDSLLNKEQRLNKDITFYKYNIYEEKQSGDPDSVRIALWENYLFEAQHDHELIIKQFESNYPKYFNLKYDHSIITTEELKKQLRKNDGLVQFSLTDSVLYTFLFSKNEFIFHSQPIDNDFFQLLNEYLQIFHQFDFSKQSYTEFTSFCWKSNSLYNLLIGPIKNYLPSDKLIIIPDGLLSYLPFETLISEIPESTPSKHYVGLDYLLYHNNISYSYSSTLYHQTSLQKKRTGTKRLLAFAPEYENTQGLAISDSQLRTRQRYRKNLFPIPGAVEEVEMIQDLISSDVFIGKSATEKKFRDIVDQYDILHLAMHAVIDNNNPLYSKLIFTLDEDSLYDGMLNTNEIFGLNLNASMVVLSACNTAEGEFNRGEGVLSLARGFVYAGTPSLVMTMWEVEDKSGAILMKEFYQNILRGETKSEALRLAKINFIENARPENAHPFFWSSFVVLGNINPLYTNQRIYYIMLIIVAGLGIFLFRKKLFRY